MDKARVAKLEARLGLVASRLTIHEPFIAAVGSKLKRVITEKGTAHTDGATVSYALDFCEPLTDAELFGLMLHELMHVVLMHMWRGKGLNHKVFNVAADAIINRYIRSKIADSRKAGVYGLPKGGVFIDWVTDDMDAEAVYRRLMKDHDPDELGAGGFDGEGDFEPAVDVAQEADVAASIMTAARMAKACGHGSALVDRVLGGGLTPRVPWEDEVLALLTSTARDDFTYARVNRRMVSTGIYLPSMYGTAIGGIVIGFDTSGSVGQKEADRIAAEIQGIRERLNPAWMKVVYCDDRVTSVQHFERDEELVLKVTGGGGTKFSPVFEYAAKLEDKVEALIYLSDLQGPFDDIVVPEYQVIWGNTYDDKKAPFGSTVRVMV